jgi:hypothetical protein
MDFLQNIDVGTIILLGGICLIGVIILIAINILGGALGIVGDLIGAVTGLIGGVTGNPISCCGCLALIGVIVVCGGAVLLISGTLSGCGTDQATNLCTLFGR